MRHLEVYTQVLASLLLSSLLLINLHYNPPLSLNNATTDIRSHAIDPPLHSSPIYSPSIPAPPSIAPVATTSTHIQSMSRVASCGTMGCLLDLQSPLLKFCIKQASHTRTNEIHLLSPNDDQHLVLNASPICVIELNYTAEIIQGDRLTISCLINSSLEYSTTLNLSLYHPLVGAVFETDLLMLSGESLFSLNLDVLPQCPPANYNLSFLLNTPEVTLACDQIPLLINPVFTMVLMELPDKAVQNQPFEATISVTNHGSRSRLITIYTEACFRGNAQVIVQPNQTRLVPIIVEYCPQNVMDIGMRLVLFTISLSTHRLVTVGASIFIGYSAMNILIMLSPLGFLLALCILGIRWLRIGKRSSATRLQLKNSTPLFQYITTSQIRGNNPTTPPENNGIQHYLLSKQIPNPLTPEYQQLEFQPGVDGQVTNNHVTLTLEENGAEIQITIPADNLLLIDQVLKLFTKKINPLKTEGDQIDQ